MEADGDVKAGVRPPVDPHPEQRGQAPLELPVRLGLDEAGESLFLPFRGEMAQVLDRER